jgi:hypothetical protein
VRQLNFYGFRKIKFADTIRINTALEQKTANFWRFRHDSFRKGREDLLVEIKRSNSNRPSNSTSDGRAKTKSKLNANSKVPVEEKKEEVVELKNELNTLKTKIAQMTSNIDELTTLVHKVTLKEKNANATNTISNPAVAVKADPDPADASASVGKKRKKVTGSPVDMVVDQVMSSASVPINTASATVRQLDEMTFNPATIFPSDSVLSSESAAPIPDSDEAFVDELFNAFGDDMEIIPDSISCSSVSVSPVQTPMKDEMTCASSTASSTDPNAPDEKLMHNLSDALTLLPKDIQELLVNRLISTITSSDALKSHLDSLDSTTLEKKEPTPMPKECATQCFSMEQNPDVALPLAAATLTALMTQFSVAMKDKKNPVLNKSLPVIPIHA